MISRYIVSICCLLVCLALVAADSTPKYTLPPLPYKYNALEPYISERTMRIHHDKHHQAYLTKFLEAIELIHEKGNREYFLNLPLLELLRSVDKFPLDIGTQIKNQGGGYYNHKFFWPLMRSPKHTENGSLDTTWVNKPDSGSSIEYEINQTFGDFETFKASFKAQASTLFGSGWTWLVADCPTDGMANSILWIENKPNQDVPKIGTPILALDVFEHAYYLDYENERGKYIDNFFQLINWDQVNANLTAACEAPTARETRDEL